MLELNADNVVDYLRNQGFLGDEGAIVVSLGGGVSNQVLRVVTDSRSFVVKQSRPQLRTRDPWYSDLERNHREVRVMLELGSCLRTTVPRILFVDPANYAYAMSDAGDAAVTWKHELLAGQIDLRIGE